MQETKKIKDSGRGNNNTVMCGINVLSSYHSHIQFLNTHFNISFISNVLIFEILFKNYMNALYL
jgi:hypothetical protein